MDNSSLVELNSSENTFLVPAVEQVRAVSQDTRTRGVGNVVQPADVFDRDVLIATYAIAGTDTPNVSLTGAMDLWKLYLTTPLIASYVAPFAQLSCDLIVTVRVLAPGACYGLYNIQALCDGGKPAGTLVETDGAALDNYHNSVQDTHAFMNLELRNDVVLHLPWVHPEDSLRMQLPDWYPWRLCIWALAPLQSTISATVPTGTIQVYARMGEKRAFENLRYQGKKKPGTLTTEDRFPTPSGGKLSGMSGKVSQGVSMLGGMFPAIAPYTMPLSLGLDAASKLAGMFGFTRELETKPPVSVVNRPFSSLTNVDGVDTSELLALSVFNTVDKDPSPGGGEHEDPMSFASLFDRWTIQDIFTLDAASTGVVYSTAVSPYVYGVTLGIGYLNTGGFVGLPFSSWRGGMEYLVYIPSSSNLQGSLQVLWSPGGTLPVIVGDPTHKLANVVIDLQGTSRTLIRVNYASFRPCLNSVLGLPGLSMGDVECNGQLLFRMNAPLTAPRVGGFSLKVIVMVRPCQDMVFGNPASRVTNAGGLVSIDNVVFQGKEEEEEEPTFVELTTCRPYPVSEIIFGEDFRSVRALVQHFCPVGSMEPVITAVVPHFFPGPRDYATLAWETNLNYKLSTRVAWTYYGWYSAPFVGQRGSTRWKLFSEGTSKQVFAMPTPPFHQLDPVIAGGTTILPETKLCGVQLTSNTNGCEFQSPNYCIHKFNYVRAVSDVSVLGPQSRFDQFLAVDSLPAMLMMAAGPDYTVTRFRRIPGFKIVP